MAEKRGAAQGAAADDWLIQYRSACIVKMKLRTMDINEQIKTMLAEHPIVLFMKGTPEFPMCGFSHRAAQALIDAGAVFHSVNVQADPQIRAALPQFANWPTFPQLFIHGELIGGCDIIEDLKAAGELSRMASDVAGVVP